MKLLTLTFLILTLNLQGQELISSKDLNGEWFVSNMDNSFFKSDTLKFVKRTNREKRDDVKLKDRLFLEPETELIESTEYVNLDFKKSKYVFLVESHQGGYKFSAWAIPIKWTLRAGVLSLTSDKFNWKFQIISKGFVSFEHLVSNTPSLEYETLNTPTITLKRIE